MGKGRNFIILEEAYWIFLIPVLNILDCFELEIACLNRIFAILLILF